MSLRPKPLARWRPAFEGVLASGYYRQGAGVAGQAFSRAQPLDPPQSQRGRDARALLDAREAADALRNRAVMQYHNNLIERMRMLFIAEYGLPDGLANLKALQYAAELHHGPRRLAMPDPPQEEPPREADAYRDWLAARREEVRIDRDLNERSLRISGGQVETLRRAMAVARALRDSSRAGRWQEDISSEAEMELEDALSKLIEDYGGYDAWDKRAGA